jgi:hypothetical protein
MADETRSAQVLIRMKPSLKQAAQKTADEDSRSLSSLIEKLLLEHLKANRSEARHARQKNTSDAG